ncbi:MAG: peptidylprolyl isomerase, partial [Candidatus Sumerlaeia bacterium]|nr:peptidylprolyl isomerase [Candidatus Sumerlaeia bacterium]
RILSAETKEPRYVKPEERDQKPFKPLAPGERLLVPMKKEEKQQVYEKIKKIYQELQNGADFDDLAQKYSQVERPGEVIGPIVPEKSEKPVLPELVEAAKKTDEGKFSDIIETKHGYQIIKIVSKQEKRQTPFEQVKHRIISQETFKSRREYADNYLKDLLKKSPLVKTYPEVLADDKASTSAVVAEIGAEKITKLDFERKLARYIANKATAAEKLEELFRLPEFIRTVLPVEAKKLNLDKEESYIKAVTQMTIDMYANAYLQKKYQTEIKMDDEELKKYYKENLDKFTTPKQYKLRQILRKIHPQVYTLPAEEKEKLVQERIKELQEIRAKIKSVEDFAAMAKEYSEDPATKDKGGEVGYVPESYQKGFDGRLQQLKPGEVSEPFERGIFVYLIMVEDIKEPQVQPFDEVKQNVERYYR